MDLVEYDSLDGCGQMSLGTGLWGCPESHGKVSSSTIILGVLVTTLVHCTLLTMIPNPTTHHHTVILYHTVTHNSLSLQKTLYNPTMHFRLISGPPAGYPKLSFSN